jgi:catechol 2,3-dioxygenase-like lactoylglutathione lyase family enzyme
MRDPAIAEGPAVHLVEWQDPLPIGSTYEHFWHVGFYRLCFKGEDVPAVYREVLAGGVEPFTELFLPVESIEAGRPAFSFADPDGVVLQNQTLPGVRRLYHVALNCSDLGASSVFYESLGLRPWMKLSTDTPVLFHFGRGRNPATFEAAIFDCPGVASPDNEPAFNLDLCRWKAPQAVGRPYGSQHHVGIARLGVAVGDVERVRSAISEAGAGRVGVPEERDFGPDVGLRTVVVARDPDGAVIELLDRPL